MTTLFADAGTPTSTFFDDLDSGTVEGYFAQTGNVQLVLTPTSTQLVGEVQNPDVELIGLPSSTQTFALGYSQSGDLVLTLTSTTGQVHTLPTDAFSQTGDAALTFAPDATQTVAYGTLTQTGDVVFGFEPTSAQLLGFFSVGDAVLAFTPASVQDHVQSYAPSHSQSGEVVLGLAFAANQIWSDLYSGPSAQVTVVNVNGHDGVTVASLNVTPEINTEIYYEIRVWSDSVKWLMNRGSLGQPVGMNLLINGVPFANVRVNRSTLVVGPYSGTFYDSLRASLLAGAVNIGLSGFEDFATYTLSESLAGDTTVRIRAFGPERAAYLFGSA